MKLLARLFSRIRTAATEREPGTAFLVSFLAVSAVLFYLAYLYGQP